uniref:CSON005493 protein n=1 Tax=Culicoides sonorensis TaxID=179676 RepID=A0A336MTF1_CULSO
MSYIGENSDFEQSPGDSINQSNSNLFKSKATLSSKSSADPIWNDRKNYKSDDSYSEMSDTDNFLAKGAFLLTPSHELTIDRAAVICEKMNFKGYFSLTKTATGILFKFSHPEDFQAVFRKGFHRVTGARFYKKVAIPCRPQKTFTLFVHDVPEDVPEEDIRHSLYRFNSIVEVLIFGKSYLYTMFLHLHLHLLPL